MFEPRLVLLDEPLGALDRQLREQMQYELKHLHQRLGVTMVYVTHDQVEAMTMSDRVAVFSAGRLRQVAEPRRLYEEPQSLFVAQFLGESNALPATVARARRRAVQRWRSPDGADDRSPRPSAPASRAARSISCCGPRRWRWARRHTACANRFPARVRRGRRSWATSCACGWRRWASEDFVREAAPTRPGQIALEPGAAVEIGWRTEDCRALVA